MSEGPSIDDYSAEFWRRAKVASNLRHLARLVRPQDEGVGTLYRYRLFELDGAQCGEAHYAMLIAWRDHLDWRRPQAARRRRSAG